MSSSSFLSLPESLQKLSRILLGLDWVIGEKLESDTKVGDLEMRNVVVVGLGSGLGSDSVSEYEFIFCLWPELCADKASL